MENIGFEGSGEELERALMDLGPLLGVSVKEEVQDEPQDAAAPPAQPTAGASTAGTESTESNKGEGADSLGSAAAARCILCSAALAPLPGTPRLLECLHSVCEPCLTAKLEERRASNRDFLGAERITITCPTCRLPSQYNNLIEQRFVIEKVALEQTGTNSGPSGDQQCNSCEDSEPATSYCVDCAEFICHNCVQAHQRLKITKDHTIKSKEEALAELQAAASHATHAHDMFCREHTQERLSLFCETCDRLTCRDCQLQHHRDHKYQFSTEMAQQARTAISSLVSEVSYKRVLLGSAMKVIRERQQLIADKKRALVHDITQAVVKLTNAINTRGKQLVLRLNEVCDAKQKTLGEKKEALEQLAAVTDHCVDFVNTALLQGSDTAVLYSKRCVCAHLQRIKSRRADIPNPEIPVRITLALDKLPDLIRVLSTIGGIVVDGKMDGGSGSGGNNPPSSGAPQNNPAAVNAGATGNPGAVGNALQQGPYHPPPHHNNHNAVMAMHHQSYLQQHGGLGALGGGYLGALQQLRARTTPLRHPHVTSTTHPHHLHGMSELNLRGLLNAGGRPSPRHPALPPAYHHMMGNMYNNGGSMGMTVGGASMAAGPASGRRSGGPRTPSPAPPQAPHPHPAAKWHIPQHEHGAAASDSGAVSGGGADFKITLRHRPPSAVTSTNPKTPSPSLNGGASMELDKVCAESVQDLMATIAKLDSNGVQVVAEPPSPPVHSSTDPDAHSRPAVKPAPAAAAGDPNEDWCAVCMDGGELMCCDKCPKVFHQYCHIPTIDKLPHETETWQCLLCVNFADMPPEPEHEGEGLSPRQQRLVERITLELYCQYETSLAFREPVPTENVHYHSKIPRPMCLDAVRVKLQPRAPERYTLVAHFVADVRLLFRNAYAYNPPDSQIYKDAKRLEEFFDAQLLKFFPDYAYWSGEGSPPAKRARLD